jgi:hypothetical protein
MQFKVPQDVQKADKIVGPLTIGQLVMSVIGGALAYSVYTILIKQGVSIIFWLPPVAFIIIITVAFAFVKIANLPFYRYLALIIERFLIPTKRSWVKGADHIVVDKKTISKEEEKQIKAQQKTEAEKTAKEETFQQLQELSSVLNTDKEETSGSEAKQRKKQDEQKKEREEGLEDIIAQTAPKPQKAEIHSEQEKGEMKTAQSTPADQTPDKELATKAKKDTNRKPDKKEHQPTIKNEQKEDEQPEKKKRRRRRRRKKRPLESQQNTNSPEQSTQILHQEIPQPKNKDDGTLKMPTPKPIDGNTPHPIKEKHSTSTEKTKKELLSSPNKKKEDPPTPDWLKSKKEKEEDEKNSNTEKTATERRVQEKSNGIKENSISTVSTQQDQIQTAKETIKPTPNSENLSEKPTLQQSINNSPTPKARTPEQESTEQSGNQPVSIFKEEQTTPAPEHQKTDQTPIPNPSLSSEPPAEPNKVDTPNAEPSIPAWLGGPDQTQPPIPQQTPQNQQESEQKLPTPTWEPPMSPKREPISEPQLSENPKLNPTEANINTPYYQQSSPSNPISEPTPPPPPAYQPAPNTHPIQTAQVQHQNMPPTPHLQTPITPQTNESMIPSTPPVESNPHTPVSAPAHIETSAVNTATMPTPPPPENQNLTNTTISPVQNPPVSVANNLEQGWRDPKKGIYSQGTTGTNMVQPPETSTTAPPPITEPSQRDQTVSGELSKEQLEQGGEVNLSQPQPQNPNTTQTPHN